MDMTPEPSVDELRQRMAQIRLASQSDVETMLIGFRRNLDWRYHLNRHPWAFAGAAALLGYLIIPKGRTKAKLDSETIKQIAAQLNLPPETKDKKGLLQQWIIPLALRWGSTGAMQIGQLLLAKMMAKSSAKQVVEEEETSFIPPHRPR